MKENNFKNSIILVRHGQTLWNSEKRTQGHLDSPLTNEGILQAKETAKKLKGYRFDLMMSSPSELEEKQLKELHLKISK